MITECYIKGRFDYGVGKCAVVITEDVPRDQEKVVLHQVAWRVPESWEYKGETIEADQFNCEILAATYALTWCLKHEKQLVNLYFNTTTCQKWYMRHEFPESRKAAAKAYLDVEHEYNYRPTDFQEGGLSDRIYVEWIKKDTTDEKYAYFNDLVNMICEKVK